MVDKKIVSLVKKERKKGTSESGIYDKLTRDGNARHDVIAAIDFVNKEDQVEGKIKKDNLMNYALIFIILLVIIGTSYYLLSSPAEPAANLQQEAAVSAPANASADAYASFQASFSACRPDEYLSSAVDGTEYYYRIIGPSEGYCEVVSMFTQNPDSSLVDVNMSCLFNNTLRFDNAVQDTSRCTGRLYNLMVGSPASPETCDTLCNDCKLGKYIKTDDGSCVECRQDSDCKDGFECFSDHTCISRQIIAVSPPCTDMTCLDYPCENCRTGYRICQGSSIAYKNNKCVECGVDAHCKAGFVCREYKCVSS